MSLPLAERIQSILASKELTLYRVSQQSVALYGRSSAFFVPHNLYSDLRTSCFTPSLHQIVALSRISGYRLSDWLTVFDFNLEDITRLQVLLTSKRTIVLDTSLTNSEDPILWFRNRANMTSPPQIAPLVQLLETTGRRRIATLPQVNRGDFLYAKIGSEDAFAFPDLAPGSIVRVNLRIDHRALFSATERQPDPLFLVEHSKGFCCCPIRPLAPDVIVPVGTLLPFARIPLRVPLEARVLGVVDMEIRPLLKTEPPAVPRDLAKRWKPLAVVTDVSLGQDLQQTRKRMNLSLREAAVMSHRIAEMLGNPHYRISPSSLYDYEQSSDSPRDFRKVASLCSMFGLAFRKFLDAAGVARGDDPAEPMPVHFMPHRSRSEVSEGPPAQESNSGFLEEVLERLQDVPVFLRNSLDRLSNSARVTFEDFYWLGGESNPFHPYLSQALFAVVNRRRKTAVHFASKPLWQQPIYLILKRDGEYMAACCGAENGSLVIHSYGRNFQPPLVFRNHQDAEVIGQIVAVVRKLK